MKGQSGITREHFELFDFHDSTIQSIAFEKTEIVLQLDFANILVSHPSNPFPVAKCLKQVTLRFYGVAWSRPELFYDQNKVFVPHPEPKTPLFGDIMEAREESYSKLLPGRIFTLAGFDANGWTEWHIQAEGFEVSWDDVLGDAWFVNWP